MPSAALTRWKTDRAQRVNELYAAHTTVGGRRPGRRFGTQQLNWSLALRLAGEFQGFARDLHDQAVDHLVLSLDPSRAALGSVLRVNFTVGRALDKGNAQPGSLGNDFRRLGFDLWATLEQQDSRAPKWNQSLEALNKVRNAIAHAEDRKLADLAAQGYPLHLSTIRAWQASLNQLATCMDHVVGASLAVLLGTSAPW